MKYLITLLIATLSLNAFGQGIPQLPYNPDENGDGLIGVPDLQALLSQYGLEFNSAVLSEDAQSAIVYMGDMAHPVCTQACNDLPGFWNMATMGDLGLVWDEVNLSNNEVWVNYPKSSANGSNVNDYHFRNISGFHMATHGPSLNYGCYCAAHELPKVEYKRVLAASNEYVNDLASEGWNLLDGAQSWSGSYSGISGVLWRWVVE
jgi:hypothetical protein